MELRSLRNLHFIGAIKRGIVEKIINVDSHGRPDLKFKTIEAIYESEAAKNQGSCTRFQQQGESIGSPYGSSGVNIDRPVLLMGSGRVKSESHLDKHSCDDTRIDDMDDLSFSEMTLKQLKEKYKPKKRKLSTVDLKKGPCSPLSENYAKFQVKEDEFDLEENLSSLKLKLLKNLKTKRKCIRKEVHLTSESADSVSVREQTPTAPQDPPQNTVDLTVPIKAEIEISGPEFAECPNFDGFTFDATLSSHSMVVISANISDEVAGLCKRSEMATRESFLSTESPGCAVREASIECLDCENSLPLPARDAVGEAMDIFSEVIDQETTSSPVSECYTNVSITHSSPGEMATRESFLSTESPGCAVREASIECLDCENSLPLPARDAVGEAMDIFSEVIDQETTSSPVSECYTNVSIAHSSPDLGLMEVPLVTNNPGPETCGSYESSSHMQGTSYETDSNSVIHVPHMLDEAEEEKVFFPVSELNTNVTITQSTPYMSSMDVPLITNKPGSEACGSCESHSFVQATSCEIDTSSVVHMPHKLNGDAFTCMNPNYDGDCILNMEAGDNSKEDVIPDPETNSDILYMPIQKSNQGLNSPSDFNSFSCSSTIEEKQKSSSLSADGLTFTGMEMENDGDIKEDNLPDPETIVMNNADSLYISSHNCNTCLDPCSSSEDFSSATDEHSFPAAEESMSTSYRVRDSSVRINPSDDTGSHTDMEVIQNFCALTLDCHPKRLFSNRKAISPSSQEKLRQAVDADQNDKTGLSKCREKLCFGKQSKINASSTASDSKGDEVNVIPRRIILKLKNEKSRPNLLLPKGILKAPNVPCVTSHAVSESTSNPFAERAIAFSERQMHDIECLAMKLVKELKCLKDIVEGKQHSEVYPSESLESSVDEMRVAIDKAGEVEETTRKWLSMMARDCSRFCRIMRSTGNKAAAAPTSSYGLQKDKKKIVFADEAGQPLCHVKVFEDPMTSLHVSNCEK